MTEMHLHAMARLRRPRSPHSHKGQMGHALLVAGSAGMAGCALLAARGCMRSGAGKLTVVTDAENRLVLQLGLPEAIVAQALPPVADPFQAIAAGPGMGIHHRALSTLQALFATGHPMVLDADALTLVARAEGRILTPAGHILTPHAGEMARLAEGLQLASATLPEQALELATRWQCHVMLKGHPTLVCCPDGSVYACPRGNAGMATAGSGDVLTGIVLGLWARGYTAHHAALLATWLHATAGDLAAAHLGQECMLAGDIVAHLPQAFAELENEQQ